MPGRDPTSEPMAVPAEDPDPHRSLSLDIVTEAGAWDTLGNIEHTLAPVLSALSTHPALGDFLPAEACLALSDDAQVRVLNRQFRNQDKATNVLSFPAPAISQEFHPPADRRSLGDIVLAFETVAREAAEQQITIDDHVSHLVAHGILHLMGYDHETDAEAAVMEALEIELLAAAGIANPYAEAGA